MKRLKIALVGRPNVGKSSLFNALCKKRIAIAHEEEGVTRDRIYSDIDFFGLPITLIDTGGIDAKSKLPLQEEIKYQALAAIEEADQIIMVVDSRVGLTVLDEEVAAILLKTEKPVFLAVNKIDHIEKEKDLHPFYQLGLSHVFPVSALQNKGLTELLEKMTEGMEIPLPQKEEKRLRVAIVGRANVGKSTLLNFILQEERAIVSPLAGTTRDSLDAVVEVEGKEYLFVDTAGIRRKKSEKGVVEKFASMRTDSSIDQADLCLLLLDAREGLRAEDKKIASLIEEKGKGCILLFNKWDLVKNFRMEHCLKAVREEAPFLGHCPARFVSCKTGKNLEGLFQDIERVLEANHQRVGTGELNRFLERAMQRVHPPLITGKRLRIYYLTQVRTAPPLFAFFTNYPNLLVPSYKKYLMNEFRKAFSFEGVPLQFKFIPKKESLLVRH